MRRVAAAKDQLLAVGGSPATDEEIARVLVVTAQGAHFENLAALTQARRGAYEALVLPDFDRTPSR
jgi:hypothetical protein